MITFLSGGTGTPKLIRGFRNLMPDNEIGVVVNTAEDMWLSGNHLSPDIDTVMYLFAGILDTDTWWGISGDTFSTNRFAKELGEDEFITIGDKDRAVHIARAEMIRRGLTLTEATENICRHLGIDATVLPMTDTEVTSCIDTDEGLLHFQEYWVKRRGQVPIRKIIRKCEVPPVATPYVIKMIEESETVVLGPSNPVTSISPILECKGMREALAEKFVIAVSPFIGDAPVSGPARELMAAWGLEPTSPATRDLYKDFVDVFVQDIRDTITVPGAVALDTLMVDEEKSTELAVAISRIIENHHP